MDDVKVKRVELLTKLRANRDSHAQLYRDALDGYKVETIKKLEKSLARVKGGEVIGSIRINTPKDHTEQYDEAISMLEMSVEDEVTLRRHEFNSYVLDKWISQEEKTMLRAMALSSSNAGLYK